MSIDQPPEGLAKFECGGDVNFAGYPITVHSEPVRNLLPEGDFHPVVHRLILRTVGRPLWEYTSDRDLLAVPRCPPSLIFNNLKRQSCKDIH
ncbi:hypothetical protein L208DRAFT_1560975 [Tricholoma matsutake]|nr:hypothetical protein L208DRAFT_1560975 [Tricholoma matsutake 945]